MEFAFISNLTTRHFLSTLTSQCFFFCESGQNGKRSEVKCISAAKCDFTHSQ